MHFVQYRPTWRLIAQAGGKKDCLAWLGADQKSPGADSIILPDLDLGSARYSVYVQTWIYPVVLKLVRQTVWAVSAAVGIEKASRLRGTRIRDND